MRRICALLSVLLFSLPLCLAVSAVSYETTADPYVYPTYETTASPESSDAPTQTESVPEASNAPAKLGEDFPIEILTGGIVAVLVLCAVLVAILKKKK